MDFLLPATVYQPPPRLGRGRQLNTIVEDTEETNNGFMSDNEGTISDSSTIKGMSFILDAKSLAHLSPQTQSKTTPAFTRRPPSVVSSECDEEDAADRSSRNSYTGSDTGTVFSDGCPSLTGSHLSVATSFVTDSSRNSIASRGSRHRLSLVIPRGSWQDIEGEVKDMPFGMSPTTKVRLSPELLRKLPKCVPALDATPSLGDASSIRSESPCPRAISSAPSTPDMHNLEIVEGQAWGGDTQHGTLDTHLEIALDEDTSLILSPQEAHSEFSAPSRYNSLVRQFPRVPGGSSVGRTPITPSGPRLEAFEALVGEAGVQLPAQALEMLLSLSQQQYSDTAEEDDVSSHEQEMRECVVVDHSRQSWGGKSAASEYSISQLSIPSPGGFFSSLAGGARHTWCIPNRKTSPPPPSSTTAENFYKTPWTHSHKVKETILEYDNSNGTDGPPTVKQGNFNLTEPAPPSEDGDMYGNDEPTKEEHEYEEAYEEGLKQAAEVNMDRTGSWLAQQNNYLSALRDNNPLNNPADFPATPGLPTEDFDRKDSIETENRKAVRFLQEAKAAVSPSENNRSPSSTSTPKESMFLEAFAYQKSETKRSDAFLHASSRLDSVQSTRIATPKLHLQSLLNTHTSKTLEPEHARPKYRGPFSQNPRNTGDFTRTEEQLQFYTLERQQTALNAIKPSLWSLEAQRTILYNGRLMANRAVWERLTKHDIRFGENTQSDKQMKKRPKILDLGGAATASWAWAAATKWSNAKVYTVRTKLQAELAQNYPPSKDDDYDSCRPQTPKNHKVFSIPHLWQLPFRDNYFDVISARTLHMYLRSRPVPGVPSINEWDLTLKECMRVLKPGGILDFFVMDSGICNNSSNMGAINLSPSVMASTNSLPSTAWISRRKDIAGEFKSELQERGYETDGGCGRLMSRLKQEGFVDVKRQWIGLPMGRSAHEPSLTNLHSRNGSSTSVCGHAYTQLFENNPRRAPFRLAPRPISEVSEISKIVDQYADVEAVQGPIGSTNDVSDMSALLGELLWEEWLVRLRIESGKYTPENILDGVYEQFSEWRRSGKAAWRGVIGWARKPTRREIRAVEVASIASYPSSIETTSFDIGHAFGIETPLPTPGLLAPPPSSAPAGIQRRSSVRRSVNLSSSSAGAGLTINTDVSDRRNIGNAWSHHRNSTINIGDYSMSAFDRGEVGDIPIQIMG